MVKNCFQFFYYNRVTYCSFCGISNSIVQIKYQSQSLWWTTPSWCLVVTPKSGDWQTHLLASPCKRTKMPACIDLFLPTKYTFVLSRKIIWLCQSSFSVNMFACVFVEMNLPLYAVFIGFSKTFDRGPCKRLWEVLKNFECTKKVVISFLYEGMQAQVVSGRSTFN